MEMSMLSPGRSRRALRHACRILTLSGTALCTLLSPQSVAGQSVAGQSVAGQPVAGLSVADQSVTGQPVAGQSVPGQPVSASELLQLNFGVYSANTPSTMVSLFKPTLQAIEAGMSKRLVRPVEIRLQIASDLDESIASLTNGLFDFSRLQPAAYVTARRANQDIRLLVAEQSNAVDRLSGVIAVRANNGITSVDELKGRSFAFGDEGSTIGRYLSQQFLQQQGVLANELSRYEYLGRNDTVGTAVAAGDFDAGAIDEKTFRSLVSVGEPLRELARFANVTQPWVGRSGLPDDIADALQQTLLDLDDAEALENLNVSGCTTAEDEHYHVIRQAMQANYRFFADPSEPTDVPEPQVAAAQAPEPAPAPPPDGKLPGAASDDIAFSFPDPLTITIHLPSALLASTVTAEGKTRLVINLDFDKPGASADGGGGGGGSAYLRSDDVDVEVRLPGASLSPLDRNGS